MANKRISHKPGNAVVRKTHHDPRDDVDHAKNVYCAPEYSGTVYQQIVQQIIRNHPESFPLFLPPPVPYFTSRKEELARLLGELQPGHIITLCGPAGIGKSALATKAIWNLALQKTLLKLFPDGVIWHDFYREPQADLALERIARAFGQEPKPTLSAAAQRALSGKQVLLVLDGTEHADNFPAVRAIMGNCGAIVTSRRCQDALSGWQALDSLAPDEAVKLLQAWGKEQATDMKAVRRICECVGSLPLALRLVGRYLRTSGEAATEYLNWLEASSPDVLDPITPEPDSVSFLVKHSLTQVSEAARNLLALCGVLAFAPFTQDILSAALPDIQLQDPIYELIGYGVLVRFVKYNGISRYTLSHPLIHTYIQEHHPPPVAMVDRMAHYYEVLADEHSKQGLEGYARLDIERIHMIRVLECCKARKKWQALKDLIWALNCYLSTRGYTGEWRKILNMGVTAAQNLNDRRDEGAFLGNLGLVYRALGQVEHAIASCEHALAIHREIGDQQGEANQLGNLGNAYRDLGQVEQAIAYYRHALTIHRELDDRQSEAADLGNLGLAYSVLGRVEQVITSYQQALVLDRQIGDRQSEASDLGNLGLAYCVLGEVEQAIVHHQQALAIDREIGDRHGEAADLGNLGHTYRDLGLVEQAIVYYQQALAIVREIGDRRNEGVWLGNLGLACYDLGEVEQAIASYQQALAIHRETGFRQGEGDVLGNLGLVCRDLGQVEQAIVYYKHALAIDREIGYRQGEASDLGNLGLAYYDLGQVEQAITSYRQALAIHRATGFRQGEGDILGNLGLAYYALGQVEQAIAPYEHALDIHREIGDRHGEATDLGNLGLAYYALGQVEQALAYYRHALAIHQQIGHRQGEANQLGNLGNAYRTLEQPDDARTYLRQSLTIFEELQSPDAKVIQMWLEELGH